MAMLTVENINVYYGVIHALKDISFQVNEGEIVALIGANGAGKTTTLQTVSGMLSAKSGSIRFSGSGDFQNAGAQNREAGNFPRPRRTPDVLQSDGFGKSEDGRLHQKRQAGNQPFPGNGL